MEATTVLEQLGYPANEARVYLAALDLGESTITDLAEKVRMPRTTVQTIINDMHKRGLMNFYIKHKRKFWLASNPERLMENVKENEMALQSIMPMLQAKRHSAEKKPAFRVFHGADEIKLIMDDIINAKHNFMAIVSWDDWRNFFNSPYVDDFIERRCRHFLKIKLLSPRTRSSIELKQKDEKELRVTKFLPSHVNIKNSNFIYDSKVAIISLNKTSPLGIVLEDPEIANTMKWLFEALWLQSAER